MPLAIKNQRLPEEHLIRFAARQRQICAELAAQLVRRLLVRTLREEGAAEEHQSVCMAVEDGMTEGYGGVVTGYCR